MDIRKILKTNCWVFCAGNFVARLFPQSLLVCVCRIRSGQLDPVRVYELVSDDEFPSLAGSKERRSIRFKRLASVTLHAAE